MIFWIISLIIIFGLLGYLYFTNRLSYLARFQWDVLLKSLSKLEKWILSSSLIAVIILNVVIGLFSSVIYDKLFPGLDAEIKIDTENIIEKQKKVYDLIKTSILDPRNIEAFTKKFPIKEGKGKVEETINEWYQNKKIDLNEKEILLLINSSVFELNKALSAEIKELKSSGNTEVVKTLITIQEYFKEGNAKAIRSTYYQRKEKIKEEDIKLLKQSIKLTESLFAYNETKDLYQELIRITSSFESYYNYALFLQEYNSFTEAIWFYTEALKIRRKFAKEYPRTYLPDVAITLNNLANLHSFKNEFPQALEGYEKALKIYRELAKESPRTYLPYVAMTLNNLANLHSIKNELPQALEKYEESLKIRRELAEESPGTYLPDVATTLNNMANLHSDKYEFIQALEKYKEALKIYIQFAEESPSTYLPYVATTLNNLAVLHSDKNEFPQALEIYEEALKIRRELAQENPRTYLPYVAMTLNNLANLHSIKNEIPQALEKYEESLKIYRELAKENPRTYEIDYAQMLIMSVDLFQKNRKNLEEARFILNNYPDVYRAQRLLETIKRLESE